MPPGIRNVNQAGTGVNDFLSSIPPITRAYAGVVVVTVIVAKLGLFNVAYLALLWPRILKKFEVWRLVTNFMWIGPPSFPWLFKMIWLLTYGQVLESQVFQFDPAGYLYMLLFGMLAINLASVFLGLYFGGSALIFMLLAVWSRHYPDQQVSIYGLFKVLSFNVPFVFLALEFLIGKEFVPCLVGLVVGHLHYYLQVLYPAMGGPDLLKTPVYLRNLLAGWGVGTYVTTHAATGQDTFRAFRGRGMRLGTQ